MTTGPAKIRPAAANRILGGRRRESLSSKAFERLFEHG